MTRNQVAAALCACILCLSASLTCQASTVFSNAIPYTQSGQATGFFNTTWPITLENFEDNSVDPFITQITGQILPPNFMSGVDNLTDSVDGDDGVLDGWGNSGRSFFSSGRSIMITFASPVHAAGLVWTDGDPLSSGVMLEAFNANGMSLGVKDYGDIGDAKITGETAEDRFLGVMDNAGIKSLLVTNAPNGNGIEIDHIQWHGLVPEPSGAVLGLLAFVFISWRRNPRATA